MIATGGAMKKMPQGLITQVSLGTNELPEEGIPNKSENYFCAWQGMYFPLHSAHVC